MDLPPQHERRLPPEVAEGLAPHIRRALDHPTRRRIVRLLDRAGAEQTLEELACVSPGASVSTLSYHVLILEECGFVSVRVALPHAGPAARSFAPCSSRDPAVARALDSTREVDAIDG